MKISEASLKKDFKKRLKERHPDWLVFSHQAWTTNGYPDLSVTHPGGTTWLEFKYADPEFTHTTSQDITAAKLEVMAGNCYHVVYYNVAGLRYTFVVRPCDIFQGKFHPLRNEGIRRWNGLDHDKVIGFLEELSERMNEISE